MFMPNTRSLRVAASNIGDLSSLLEYTNYFDEFKRYRLNLFSSILKKLGWDASPSEDPLSAMLRPMILSIAGKSGDQDVISEAKKRFQRHIDGDLMDPNIRGAVYVIVARYGDEGTQEELRKVGHHIRRCSATRIRSFSCTPPRT